MMPPNKFYLCILSIAIPFASCFTLTSDKQREDGKIFHAALSSEGISGLYFGLYKDKTYQICSTGGIGQTCYSGCFDLINDTISFSDLNKEIHLKSNRLLIKRYAEQDSSYWNWKYAKSIRIREWQDSRRLDSAGGTGDVYQLNDKNELMKDEFSFIIRLDSLKISTN